MADYCACFEHDVGFEVRLAEDVFTVSNSDVAPFERVSDDAEQAVFVGVLEFRN